MKYDTVTFDLYGTLRNSRPCAAVCGFGTAETSVGRVAAIMEQPAPLSALEAER